MSNLCAAASLWVKLTIQQCFIFFISASALVGVSSSSLFPLGSCCCLPAVQSPLQLFQFGRTVWTNRHHVLKLHHNRDRKFASEGNAVSCQVSTDEQSGVDVCFKSKWELLTCSSPEHETEPDAQLCCRLHQLSMAHLSLSSNWVLKCIVGYVGARF